MTKRQPKGQSKQPKRQDPKGTPTTKFFNKSWEEVPAKKSLYAVTIWHGKDGEFLGRRIGIRQGATA